MEEEKEREGEEDRVSKPHDNDSVMLLEAK